MVTKKKTSKKKVSKKKNSTKKSTGKRFNSSFSRDEIKNKKNLALTYMFKFGILFVLSIVLYYATSNPILEELFGLVTIVGGAVFFAFLLIFISFILYLKRMKK